VTAIEGITLKQGIDPTEAVMIGGGGGAGLYAVGIARRLGVSRAIVPDVAAALSAAGALLSDLQATFAATEVMSTASFDRRRAAAVLDGLRAQGEQFIAAAGSGAVETGIRFTVEARYPHQVWEIEVPLRSDRIETAADVGALREDFHEAHEELFAVRDEDAPVEIVTWRAHARCALRRGAFPEARPERSRRPVAAERQAYFPESGLVASRVRDLEALAVGERLAGPVLIESPVTTVVVDERAVVERAPSGSLLLEPLAVDEAAAVRPPEVARGSG
jgi:N-methylhydantoinase A